MASQLVVPAIGTYLVSRWSGDDSTAIWESDVMDTIVTIRSIEDGCAVLAGIRPNAPSRRVLLANLDAQFRPLYAHEQEALEAYLANAELAEQPASFEAWEVKACPGCKQLVYESGAHRCSDGSGRTVYPEHLKTIWAVPQPVTD